MTTALLAITALLLLSMNALLFLSMNMWRRHVYASRRVNENLIDEVNRLRLMVREKQPEPFPRQDLLRLTSLLRDAYLSDSSRINMFIRKCEENFPFLNQKSAHRQLIEEGNRELESLLHGMDERVKSHASQ